MHEPSEGQHTTKWTECKRLQSIIYRTAKLSLLLIKIILHIIFWPLLTTFKRCFSEIKFANSYGKDRFEAQLVKRDHMVLSSRARMIEVCIESSFQPLLQLYLVLPTLIQYFDCLSSDELIEFSLADTLMSIPALQFLSVITSVIALSWSINFYKVTQKHGALDLNVNFSGRICLQISTFLQISCRLLTFVLLSYCFGPGNFWPMIAILQLHILLMAVLHYYTTEQRKFEDWRSDTITNLRLLHHCILNGIGNIYIHNRITYMDSKTEAERMKLKFEKHYYIETGISTFWRQVISNLIFVLENMLIIILVYTSIPGIVPNLLLIFIPIGHLIGIIFNIIYYKFFHIWKDAFSLDRHISLTLKPSFEIKC